MKKLLAGAALFTLSFNSYAEIMPYASVGLNVFSIDNESSAFGAEATSDGGTTAVFNGGVLFGSNSKVNVFYFSGEEDDSNLMKATVSGISYDYNFNNQGAYRGIVLGAGISNVETEFKNSSLTTATSDSSTGLLLRLGYDYLMDNGLFLSAVLNYNTAEQKHKPLTAAPNAEFTSTVNDISFSVGYAF